MDKRSKSMTLSLSSICMSASAPSSSFFATASCSVQPDRYAAIISAVQCRMSRQDTLNGELQPTVMHHCILQARSVVHIAQELHSIAIRRRLSTSSSGSVLLVAAHIQLMDSSVPFGDREIWLLPADVEGTRFTAAQNRHTGDTNSSANSSTGFSRLISSADGIDSRRQQQSTR